MLYRFVVVTSPYGLTYNGTSKKAIILFNLVEVMKFTDDELLKCYFFSKKMIGNHNPDMIMQRRDWEIFRDDFRGKLGEVAVRKTILQEFPNFRITSDIDYSVTPRGQWDITDLNIGGSYISIKSVKGRSRFLLIERKRYNADGSHAYTNSDNVPVKVDAYILVRVNIEPDMKWTDMNFNTVEQIKRPFPNVIRQIDAEILGGITHTEFWMKKHFAPRGIQCNIQTLSAIARGETNLPQAPEGMPKTAVLQQDNYLLSCSELLPLKQLFKALV